MAQIIDISQPLGQHQPAGGIDEFIQDVFIGLSNKPKMLKPKYFYDEKGSELFNQITQHVDYYLTSCEIEILQKHKDKIAKNVKNKPVNLIELGPGEGIKTQLLIDHFLKQKIELTYVPIDISSRYLKELVKKMDDHQPGLSIYPICGDYFHGLKMLSSPETKPPLNWSQAPEIFFNKANYGTATDQRHGSDEQILGSVNPNGPQHIHSKGCNVVLFFGSSIGNFSLQETKEFLHHLRVYLHVGDYVLIGFDLRKDIKTLIRAYNDTTGITRAFNLNLLERMNRELGGDFDLNQFDHRPVYNKALGTMESYLVSLKKQVVSLAALNQSFNFDLNESMHVESSCKYALPQIENLAKTTGFRIVDHYLDSRAYFTDSLWQIV